MLAVEAAAEGAVLLSSDVLFDPLIGGITTQDPFLLLGRRGLWSPGDGGITGGHRYHHHV